MHVSVFLKNSFASFDIKNFLLAVSVLKFFLSSPGASNSPVLSQRGRCCLVKHRIVIKELSGTKYWCINCLLVLSKLVGCNFFFKCLGAAGE